MVALGTPWQDLVAVSVGYRARTLEALLAAFGGAGRAVPAGVIASAARDLLRGAIAEGSIAPVTADEVYFDRDGIAHVDRDVPPAIAALTALFGEVHAEDGVAPRSFVRACVDAVAGGPGSWRLAHLPELPACPPAPVTAASCPLGQAEAARPVYRHQLVRSTPVTLSAAPVCARRFSADAPERQPRVFVAALSFAIAMTAAGVCLLVAS